MKTSDQHRWSLDEIAGILRDRMTPAAAGVVIGILRNEERAMREEQEETVRMERMIGIIDKYDELALLYREGGTVLKPDGIIDAASNYLDKVRGVDVKDDLDAKARSVALYILTALDGLYDGVENIVEILSQQPLIEEIREELLRQGFALKNKTGEES